MVIFRSWRTLIHPILYTSSIFNLYMLTYSIYIQFNILPILQCQLLNILISVLAFSVVKSKNSKPLNTIIQQSIEGLSQACIPQYTWTSKVCQGKSEILVTVPRAKFLKTDIRKWKDGLRWNIISVFLS